jgi:hypothetical protein
MLIDTAVRQIKTSGKPFYLADHDGLYLHVSAVGGKAWHFRYTWLGVRHVLSFGSYPDIPKG